MTKLGLGWGYKRQLHLAAETVREGTLCTPQTIYWTTSRFMPRIIMTEPEDFPDPLQAEFFQNLCLLMRVELTPGTIDLDGHVDSMRAEALISFGDVFVTLLTDAVHPGSLLSGTSP
jgi:hypothetical protein